MTTVPVPPSAATIARRADELRIVYLGLNVAAMALSHPSLPLLRFLNELTETSAGVDVPFDVSGAPGDPTEQFSAQEVLDRCASMSGDTRTEDVLSVAMMQGAIRIGTLID